MTAKKMGLKCGLLDCEDSPTIWCTDCGAHTCSDHGDVKARLCNNCADRMKLISDEIKATAESQSILVKAQKIVDGPRQEDYGRPHHSYKRVAEMWSAILGFEVTPRRVCLCLIAMKVARDAHRPKEDNLIDIAGYARVIEMIERDSHGF